MVRGQRESAVSLPDPAHVQEVLHRGERSVLGPVVDDVLGEDGPDPRSETLEGLLGFPDMHDTNPFSVGPAA